ncbi:MAG: EF-hand domain-containing protein [Verrucomicrobiaceae bacterium]|nr:EF-hand domain-containing protein [Verrucomicrobiaceae bacterium]
MSLEKRFDAFDSNHDGKLTGGELAQAPYLRNLDADKNGEVTLAEARVGVLGLLKKGAEAAKTSFAESGEPNRTAAVFERLDKNGDGRLTADELQSRDWFGKLDSDHDGAVTLEEATRIIGQVIPKRFVNRTSGADVNLLAEEKSLSEQPQQLKGSSHLIGRMVDDVELPDLNGKTMSLRSLQGNRPLVIGLFGATCPISLKLGPEMKRLEMDFAALGVAVVWVAPVPVEEMADMKKFVSDYELTAPVLHDKSRALSVALRASTTTEAFLLDAAHTLVYRGAINDQYGLGYAKDKATFTYLRDAVASVLAGGLPTVAATTAPGCALDVPPPAVTQATQVTYHKQIARTLQTHCIECHRDGGIGPFALTSYGDVVEHAAMIRKQVERGAMPPWFARPPEEGANGVFVNDCSLSADEKEELLTWLSSERLEGNVADAPVPRVFVDEWTIGKPDAVFQIPRPITIKAEGAMPYQNTFVETSFAEDRWVQAYEIIPTARQVVHHVIVKVHPKGSKIVDRGEGSEGYWAAYVPGNSHRVLPEGFAKKLPAGARLSFQIHYTPTGKEVQDQLKIGVIFAKEPPKFEVHVAALANPRIRIPAGAPNHVETFSRKIPGDMMFTAFMPHMHTRGKAFKYEVTFPDGRNEVLLDVPRYDFNWQLQYQYATPRRIPAGSTVKVTAVFDNSTGNPANPDPTKEIRWGQQTWDEMMIGYVEHYTPMQAGSVAKQ